jgi:hypothetical protein
MNPVPVIAFELILRTNPPQVVGGEFDAALELNLLNVANPILLPVRSSAELAAIAALLQLPGKLFFVEQGGELIKQGQ